MNAPSTLTARPIVNQISTLRAFLARPYSRAILVYTLGALVALLPIYGDEWTSALRRLALVGVSIGLFFLIAFATASRPRLLRWMAGLLVAATVGIAVLGTARLDTTELRLTGLNNQVHTALNKLLPVTGLPSVNKNVLGDFLVTFLPLAVALAIWGKAWWLRLYSLVGTLVISGAIIVTTSRSALLGMAVLVFVFLFFLTGTHPRFRVGLGLVALLSLLGGVIYLVLNGLSSLESGTSRIEVWRTTLAMIADYPITGTGLGQFPAHFPEYATPFLAGNALPHAHNLFLQSLVEFGLIGLIAIILMLWTTVRLLITFHNLDKIAAPLRPILAGSIAGMTVYFVTGMLDYGNWNGKFAPAFWILPAILAAGVPGVPLPDHNSKVSGFWARVGEIFTRRWVRLPGIILGAALVIFLMVPLALINIGTLARPTQSSQTLYRIAAVSSFWNATPLRDLGKLALSNSDPANAEGYFKQAIERDPNDWLSLLALADLSEKAGNHAQAVAYWGRAVGGLDFILLASQALARNPPDHPAAEKYYRQALELNPDNPQATSGLIRSYIDSDNRQEALAFLQRASSLSLEDAGLYWNFGNKYLALNQPEAATEIFKRVKELRPDFQPPTSSLEITRS